MHDAATVAEALRLRAEEGLGARRAARRLGLPLATVRDWYSGTLPRHSSPAGPPICATCGHDEHRYELLGRDYVYLLGLYLGDGTISKHRRDVFKLRIFLDKKYPAIVDECEAAMAEVMPKSAADRFLTVSNCFEVYSFSKAWPCLFPQHGPGMKHTRRIWLAEWQQELAERWPEALLRGMVQSDGCRSINTGRGGWRHPRYSFSNVSTRHHQHLLHGLRSRRTPLDGRLPVRRAQGGEDVRLAQGRRCADGRVHRAEAIGDVVGSRRWASDS